MSTKKKILAGQLLVAQRSLLDPNFFQSIVYIAKHTQQGTIGFVMNRPMGVMLDKAVSHTNESESFFSRIPVMNGGPVATDQIAIVVFRAARNARSVRSLMNQSLEHVEAYIDHPDACVLAFRGYAGWESGQLSREIREESWLQHPSDATLLNPRIVEGLWPFLIGGDMRWRVLLDYLPNRVEWN